MNGAEKEGKFLKNLLRPSFWCFTWCVLHEKKIYIYQKVNSKKKITSIKTQASESIFLHEFSIYIHFMLSKTIESAMLKFMALGKPDKIEDLTEPVAESGWSHPFVLAGHVTHLNICS